MSSEAERLVGTARALRRAFDRSFAGATEAERGEAEDFLVICVGAETYALRLGEVTGLYADRKIVPVPSSQPELLGIVGLRGALAAVYDLRTLLEQPNHSTPRWLLLTRALEPIGLAFDRFDRHLRCPRRDVSSSETDTRKHLRGTARFDGRSVPILHIPSLLDAIKRSAGS